MNLDQEENDFFKSEESFFRYQSIDPKIIRIFGHLHGFKFSFFLIGSVKV